MDTGKRKVLVDWINGIGLDECIESLCQIRATHLIKLLDFITSQTNDGEYDTIKAYLEDHFQKSLNGVIDFDSINKSSNDFEIAKVVLLVLCAGVDIPDNTTFMEPAMKLDMDAQAMVMQMIEPIVLKRGEDLKLNFHAILGKPPDRPSTSTPTTPHKASGSILLRFASPQVFSTSNTISPVTGPSSQSPRVAHRMLLQQKDERIKFLERELHCTQHTVSEKTQELRQLNMLLQKKDLTLSQNQSQMLKIPKLQAEITSMDVLQEENLCLKEELNRLQDQSKACKELAAQVADLEKENHQLCEDALQYQSRLQHRDEKMEREFHASNARLVEELKQKIELLTEKESTIQELQQQQGQLTKLRDEADCAISLRENLDRVQRENKKLTSRVQKMETECHEIQEECLWFKEQFQELKQARTEQAEKHEQEIEDLVDSHQKVVCHLQAIVDSLKGEINNKSLENEIAMNNARLDRENEVQILTDSITELEAKLVETKEESAKKFSEQNAEFTKLKSNLTAEFERSQAEQREKHDQEKCNMVTAYQDTVCQLQATVASLEAEINKKTVEHEVIMNNARQDRENEVQNFMDSVAKLEAKLLETQEESAKKLSEQNAEFTKLRSNLTAEFEHSQAKQTEKHDQEKRNMVTAHQDTVCQLQATVASLEAEIKNKTVEHEVIMNNARQDKKNEVQNFMDKIAIFEAKLVETQNESSNKLSEQNAEFTKLKSSLTEEFERSQAEQREKHDLEKCNMATAHQERVCQLQATVASLEAEMKNKTEEHEVIMNNARQDRNNEVQNCMDKIAILEAKLVETQNESSNKLSEQNAEFTKLRSNLTAEFEHSQAKQAEKHDQEIRNMVTAHQNTVCQLQATVASLEAEIKNKAVEHNVIMNNARQDRESEVQIFMDSVAKLEAKLVETQEEFSKKTV